MAQDEQTEELDARTKRDLVLAVFGGGRMQELRLPRTGEITIGRSSHNRVQLDDAAVSSRHAVLQVSPLAIKDLGSRNGLWIQGRRIEPGRFVPLTPREVVEIGVGFLSVRPMRDDVRPRRIWSHDYVEGRIEEECARRARTGGSFAVIRLRLPEGRSEAACDEALVTTVRGGDVIGRYAPREYWLLLVDTDPEDVDATWARLRGVVAGRLDVADDTVAVGVALWPRDGTSSDELMSHAAAALAGTVVTDGGVTVVAGSQLEAVLHELTRVAASDLAVLILGETGVGKEACAEAVHRRSRRHAGPLLRLNCAAFPAEMIEGELFGYEKGAFTGAAQAKPGLFASASGGTVFIDEVGDLPPAVQLKLLRVIDSREVMRLGALEPQQIDVRFVSATHRDLETEVAHGRFREDLYYRLAGITVFVPPLRQRRDEIPTLVEAFVGRAAARLGVPPPTVTAAAMGQLTDYAWPGNIRELRNVVERAVVLAGRGPIDLAHLPGEKIRATVLGAAAPVVDDERARSGRSRRAHPVTLEPPTERTLERTAPFESVEPEDRPTLRAEALRAEFRDREKAAILEAMQQCAGNQSRAARLLGMSRGTLIAKLDAYGFPRPRK
ncbi:MAG: sigma 54-interacting transcriptional regulator [Kofleriaceae bacterium]|nr:sigma 54-interacting transcriptional regulator [Myxococcales bacterium]MCB9562504.1 sigma 54-interacting transcriptional regulator [Kofleriaceae bacterium]MCB9570735.1 sigma 54-interacting transcriptional regulator [Kofleriaceae bacterium]